MDRRTLVREKRDKEKKIETTRKKLRKIRKSKAIKNLLSMKIFFN